MPEGFARERGYLFIRGNVSAMSECLNWKKNFLPSREVKHMAERVGLNTLDFFGVPQNKHASICRAEFYFGILAC